MEIILGKTAGFCTGITLALDKTEKELEKSDKVECLGDLLHNNQVLNKLKSKGLHIINDIKMLKLKKESLLELTELKKKFMIMQNQMI